MCALYTVWLVASSIARVAEKGRATCNATPTATAVITSATLIANTIVRKAKNKPGEPKRIPLNFFPTGYWPRVMRSPRRWSEFKPKFADKWKRLSSSRSQLRIQTSAKWRSTSMLESATRELTFAQAVREALAEEMRRDSRVCIIGEDVAEAGTPFKVLSGLVEEFGAKRVVDTPISEAGFTGIAVGAAMTGLRPVVDIMFGDFITLTMDQMVNQAAKIHYMSGGEWRVPMVLRTTLGATRRSAAQHSQSLHAWFSHVPGLKVVMPSTPHDAKGLLKTAIRDENPVVFFEDKMMYTKLKGPVPSEEYTIPFGLADVKRVGSDITLVATSSMVQVALGAAELLQDAGISAEVIDPRTTWPLDEKTLIDSVKKTSRA